MTMRLRAARSDDLALLRGWDAQPHVRAAGVEDWGWEEELGQYVDWRWMFIAESGGRPVGFIQVIDPAREDTGYWGDVPAGLRAVDVWIGDASDLGQGMGTRMMELALAGCFAEPDVEAVLVDPLAKNAAAHRFYQRLGFVFEEERRFPPDDDCHVYRLKRSDWLQRAARMVGTDPDPGEVLAYWFGADGTDGSVAERQSALWWSKDDSVDARIRERFGRWVELAGAGGLAEWRQSPLGWLALIVLTDQFPRNIHRDTPLAFAFDARARDLCRDGLERGLDRQLRPIQRVFAYLPLEHAEDMDLQRLSVRCFRGLLDDVPEVSREAFAGFVDFAVRHLEIVERFGRFPHRNRIIGRPTTPEEAEFLGRPGSSF